MTRPVSQKLSTVEAARARTLSDIPTLTIEEIPIEEALGRVLAEDIIAQQALPPEAVSAMDGYAVISSDVATKGAQLRIIGMAPAGGRFDGTVTSGETVRIFTGGPIPRGADRVVVQENVTPLAALNPKGGREAIEIPEAQTGPAHIRDAGIDFKTGRILATQSTHIGPNLPGLIAAANCARLRVYKKPRIGIISSGDELVPPGTRLDQGQIVNSAAFGLMALCQNWGAHAHILGILPDHIAKATQQLQALDPAGYEVLVTIGGASVGDRDLVKPALCALGSKIELEKVAVKPGKPYWTGRLGQTRLIGLPGNPSSAFVCAYLFLKPLIYALSGRDPAEAVTFTAKSILTAVPENGDRESYLRAVFAKAPKEAKDTKEKKEKKEKKEEKDAEGGVELLPAQDSSLLSSWARATCLVRRKPGAPRIKPGDIVYVLPLE